MAAVLMVMIIEPISTVQANVEQELQYTYTEYDMNFSEFSISENYESILLDRDRDRYPNLYVEYVDNLYYFVSSDNPTVFPKYVMEADGYFFDSLDPTEPPAYTMVLDKSDLCLVSLDLITELYGFDGYFVDHTAGIYPVSAGGHPFSAQCFASKGDIITDLHEDLAADGAVL